MLRILIEPIVRAALLEDLGRAGDITSEAVVPAEARIDAVIAARQPGVLAGLEAGLLAFELLDPTLRIERLCPTAPASSAARRSRASRAMPAPCSPPSGPR